MVDDMSWKLRRAHHYQRQRGVGGAEPEIAKWINFWLLIGITLIFILLIIDGSNADIDAYPIIGVLAGLGILSLLGTPFLFILACLADTLKHGLPNFSVGTSQSSTYIKNQKYLAKKRTTELDVNVQIWEEIYKSNERSRYTFIRQSIRFCLKEGWNIEQTS